VVGDIVASDAVAPSTAKFDKLAAANESVCHSCKTAVALVLPMEDIKGVSVGEIE
jgi:hypothetical protein